MKVGSAEDNQKKGLSRSQRRLYQWLNTVGLGSDVAKRCTKAETVGEESEVMQRAMFDSQRVKLR